MGKRVEYRDTFDFRLFPEYTYTRAQNRRLRLFQGRVEHWRAAINYADSFNYPNEINLLYMIGYKPQMKAYVEKTVSNVVVLCADVPPEFLAAYDAYWGFVKQYRGTGYVNQDGVFSPAFFAEREKEEAYRGTGILPDELYRRNDEQAAIISAYQRITEESEKYFSHYLIISKSIPECSISHDELDWLIQEYFPFGREQCGIGEKAYRSLRKIEEALRAGLNRADTAKLLDLPNGVDSYTACQNGIKQCQMNLSVAMQNDGLVDLVQLMEDMKKPPFGTMILMRLIALGMPYVIIWIIHGFGTRFIVFNLIAKRSLVFYVMFSEEVWDGDILLCWCQRSVSISPVGLRICLELREVSIVQETLQM